MRKLFIITFIVLICVFYQVAGFSDELANIFNQANKNYAEKNYLKALDLYLEIIERGIVNPDVYYNIANTYFKIGKKGLAILYYEKALEIKPFDREIRDNLRYVEKTIGNPSSSSKGSFSKIPELLASYFNLRILSYIELGFFILFMMIFLTYTFIRHMRFSLKPFLFVFLTIFVLLFSGVVYLNRYSLKHPRGVIVQPKVEALEAPISTSEPAFLFIEGTRVKVLETRGDWLLVATPDGKQGWIMSNQFEEI